MSQEQVTIGKKIGVIIAIPIAIVISLSVLFYRDSLNSIHYTNGVGHTIEDMTAIRAIRAQLGDVGTVHLNFLKKGEESYIKPYKTGIDLVWKDFDNVQQLMKDNTDQLKRMDVLKSLIMEIFDGFNKTIEVRRLKGYEAAHAIVLTGAGAKTMDSFQKLIIKMLEVETALLKKRNVDEQAGFKQLNNLSIIGIFLAFLFSIATSILIYRVDRTIAELKLAENKIRSSAEEIARTEEQFRQVVEAAPNGMVMVNKEGKIGLLNKATEVLFGYDRADLLGQEFEVLVPRWQGQYHQGHKAPQNEFHLAEEESLYGLKKDGSQVPIEIGLNSIDTRDGKFVLASIMDTTKRKKIEEERNALLKSLEKRVQERAMERRAALNIAQDSNEARKRAEAAEQAIVKTAEELARSNKELEQFAYVASHDLQEPLRMVASFTQLLERKNKDKLDEQSKEYIDFVVDGAKRMQNLIDSLLAFSRLGQKDVSYANVDLNETCKRILEDMSLSISESHATIEVDKLPVLYANETQMSQLFLNLISNGIKYRLAERPPVIRVSSRKIAEHQWEFSISDNGIGIDEKYFGKLFVIFQRLHTKKAYKGTGIGLALCKKIVDNYHGRIWIESKIGEGTIFHFILKEEKIHEVY